MSASLSDFQKRRRLRRTYQLLRSSTNCWIARVVPVASYASSPAVTSRTSACSSPTNQRSSRGRSSSGDSPAAGSKRSMLAYTVKKLYVFHSVSRNLRTTSSTISAPKRRGLQGCWLLNMYQRKASAPCRSRISSGWTMLPLLLLIF
ncbi:MAG: hypothetical protein BWY94_02091 [Actinobacteria bacterium ADurb.BinA094]|nr:MAG: hypothetical protein BWY94_02091 [Actinobacteria bacterium ADurb.BinA094]